MNLYKKISAFPLFSKSDEIVPKVNNNAEKSTLKNVFKKLSKNFS